MSDKVHAITVDQDNVKWFATGDGVSSYFDRPGPPVTVTNSHTAPEVVTITGNYPNPFNPATTIAFTLAADVYATLDIYDITGRHVKALAAGHLPAGNHAAIWDSTDAFGEAVSSGVYFARLTAGGRTVVKRIALVR